MRTVVILQLAALLVVCCGAQQSCPCDSYTNKTFLMEFYTAMNGPTWGVKHPWGTTDTTICQWSGLGCYVYDANYLVLAPGPVLHGTVPRDIGLHLTNLAQVAIAVDALTHNPLPASLSYATQLNSIVLRGFCGTLPPSWGSLSALKVVDVSQGASCVTGSLPSEWGNMTNLIQVFLNDLNLSGPLPTSWSALTNLQIVQLQNNALTGPIPTSWSAWSRYVALDLSNNQLTGTPDLCTFNQNGFGCCDTNLTYNKFSGVPNVNCFTNGCESSVLQNQFLTGNDFCGACTSLPACCFCDATTNKTALMDFFFAVQGPTWNVPNPWGTTESICHWYGLSCGSDTGAAASLLNMDLSGLVLNGTLPDNFGHRLSNLVRVELIVGGPSPNPLPDSLGYASNLTSMHLSGFSGILPRSWGLLTTLENLTLQSSGTGIVSGTLPCEWQHMASLQNLVLRGLDLFGPLPSCWTNLTALLALDLSSNALVGRLPEAWSQFTALRHISLAHNQLSGPMPGTWNTWARAVQLNVSHNQLSGNPNLCEFMTHDDDLSYNNFTGVPDVTCFTNGCSSTTLQEHFLAGNQFCARCNLPKCSTGCNLMTNYTIDESATIGYVEVHGIEECCAKCHNTTLCVAAVFFIYDTKYSYCELKNATSPLIAKKGYTVVIPTS